MPAAISAGVAYIDVLPNMKKFAPATQAQASASTGMLAKFGKTGALAVAAVGAASVVMAADFEKSMRNVNSIAQLPEERFKRLNDQVLALAGPTAQAPKTLADGLYDLVSSGFSANDSLKILKSSAIAATAGLTTTETSTKAVAAVLNAYKLPASAAGKVSDELFKTVDRGVISFEELAANVGDVLSVANSIGAPLSNVGAALATMTKQGESAPEASTKLKAAMTALVKPSEDMKTALDELNVASGAELVKKEGSLQAALQAVTETTDGSAEAMNELFPNVRAAQGALLLTGANAKGAAEDLRELEDSAGATERAFKEQSKGLSFQWDKMKANLAALAIKIGTFLIPPITDAMKWLNTGLGPALEDVAKIAGNIGTAIGTAFTETIDWIQQAVANVKGFLADFIPLQIVVGAFKLALWALQPVFAAIMGIARIFGSVVSGAFKIVIAVVKALWENVKAAGRIIGDVIGFLSNLLRGDFAGAWRNLKELAASVVNAIKTNLRGVLNVAKTVFKAIFNVAKSVWNLIAGVVKAQLSKMGDIVGVFKSIATGAFRVIASVAKAVWSAIKSVVGAVAGFIGDRIRDAVSIVKSVFQSLRDVAQGVFNAVKGFVNTLLSPVRAVADAIRGLINLIQGLASNIGNAIGAAGDLISKVKEVGSLPGKALDAIVPNFQSGGPIGAGQAAIVGEAGPELFVPRAAGRIIPNGALVAGTGTGRYAFVIENWEDGSGHMRRIASSEDRVQARYDRQRERQRRR